MRRTISGDKSLGDYDGGVKASTYAVYLCKVFVCSVVFAESTQLGSQAASSGGGGAAAGAVAAGGIGVGTAVAVGVSALQQRLSWIR